MMRIGEFLKRNKTALTIQDGVKYKRVTIKVRNGGISLRDEILGEKIGTKKTYISRLENGKADVQLTTLFRIFEGLGRKVCVTVL